VSERLAQSLEDNVLTMLCWDEDHASEILMQVPPDLFSSRNYRKIATAAADHIEVYGHPPRAHLRDVLERDLLAGENGLLLQRILSDMDTLRPEIQPAYVLTQLDKFIALRKISRAIENASDAVQQGNVEKAQTALYQGDYSIRGSAGIWLHKPEQMLAFFNQREEDFFPSGVEALDIRGVRPKRKTLFLVLAPKKSGKSFWLVEIGKQALLHKKSVLHITLEMSEEQVAKRYCMALFAMTSNYVSTIRVPIFKRDQLGRCTSIDFDDRAPIHLEPSIAGELAKRLEALRNRSHLLIKEFPTGNLTVSQLQSFLDSLARREHFTPDLLMIDYPKIMKHDMVNMRLSIGRNLEEIRGLGVERNMAIVAPAQANRSSENARVVTSGMLSEDWSMSQTADIICSISRTKAEREIGLARVFVDSAREVEDKFLVHISQSYATGQFCLDSVYMSKHIEHEIERISGEEEEGDD
jgi:replicative DNA helicase